MQRLHDLADSYNTHIILVLHPNKTYRKGQDMDMEQISGTSDLYNKADNIISVSREYEEDIINQGVHGKVSILKNRDFPDIVQIETHFHKETGLLLEIDKNTGDIMAYSFNVDNNEPPIEGFQLVVGNDCPF